MTSGVFHARSATLLAPPTARFAKVVIQNGAAGDAVFHVDDVTVSNVGEAWRSVGAGGVEPAFTNSWVNYGSPHQVARFRKNPGGKVEIQGLIRSGTLSAAAFTLPVGYRPPADMDTATDANGAFGRLVIQSNGQVLPVSGSNAWFSIWVPAFHTF